MTRARPSVMRLAATLDALSCDQIVASVEEPGAGTSYSVPSLSARLLAQGLETRLHVVQDWRSSPGSAALPADLDLRRHKPSWRAMPGLCASFDLERALRVPRPGARVFHVQGLWSMLPSHAAAAKRSTGAALVVSPRGMLGGGALEFSTGRKRLFAQAFQNRALSAADCFHATSDAEHEDIRSYGLKAPVTVIPNGIDLPAAIPAPSGVERDSGLKTVLSLGRIHPKKGLDRLLRAWREVEGRHPDWRLRIVGPPEIGHDAELRALATDLGLRRATIEGPAYDDAKSALYFGAHLFVLPTRSENFAMTVAEALAHGLPVISTKGAPWAGLEPEGCGWWVDGEPEAIAAALDRAMTMPVEALSAMGRRGCAWMDRDFSWDRVAADMIEVYQWLRSGGEPPATVRFD